MRAVAAVARAAVVTSAIAFAMIAATGAGCGRGTSKPKESPAERAERAWTDGNHLLLEVADDRAIRASIDRYEEAATLWREGGELSKAGQAISRAGAAHYHLRELDASEQASREALALFRAAGDRANLASGLDSLATDLMQQGKLDESIASAREAMAIYRELSDEAGLGSAELSLAAALLRQDRWDEAIAILDGAELRFERLGLSRLAADTHSNRGFAYYLLGDAERALHHHERALATWQSQPDARDHARDVGRTLQNLGAVKDELLGDSAAGLAHYQEAVAILRAAGQDTAVPQALAGVGRAQLHLGHPREALAALEEALSGFRTKSNYRSEINALHHLAEAHLALGALGPAAEACDRAVALADDRASPALAARGRRMRAAVHRAAGRLPEARVDAVAAVDGLEALRASISRDELRASYLATVRGAYELLAELDAGAGAIAAGFATSERAHARALVDAIAAAGGAAHAPRLVDAAGAQALLDGDTVLIEYLVGDERTWAWAVTRDGIAAVPLARGADLAPIARTLIAAITARNQAPAGETLGARQRRIAAADRAVGPAARAAAAALLDPLRAHLGKPRVVIVADGILHYLPFAALPDPEGGRPLGLTRALWSVPSASVLAELRARPPRAGGGGVAILADPIFAADDPRLGGAAAGGGAQVAMRGANDGAPAQDAAAKAGAVPAQDDARLAAQDDARLAALARLPFTATEAEAIAAIAPDRTRTYAGAEATLAALAAPEVRAARYVHLATHGVIDTARPDHSGLVLSRFDAAGAPRDGLLGPAAIERLALAAELVVLSACDSALGRRVHGEGLVGLVHAFFRAGTPRTIATLWSIEDRATATFMTALYRDLLAGDRGPAAALQAARAALLADPRTAAPYYWAGFVLHGDFAPPAAVPAAPSP